MLIKCKACGGELRYLEGTTTCVCEYCDLLQTFPLEGNEVSSEKFNNANELRIKKRYDAALAAYMAILDEMPRSAEAYWGIVLCRYGVEYVEDYDGTRKPTIHRMQYESILNDEDYLNVLRYAADPSALNEYKREAAEIGAIQKKISETIANEEPYEVFISYKESDEETGMRTVDSGTAKLIYDELSSQDYRVFYSRVSLKKAIGEDFEARIFAALHSAKVMILISSKLEYANSIWVKNEWERYLQLMQKDENKHLITVFRGNPNDCFPSVLAQMQGQNAAEPAAEKYIAEGVEKYIGKKEKKQETAFVSSGLLKRAFMYLEDQDYAKADEQFNRVLEKEPKNGRAYLGKLMASLKVQKESELIKKFDNGDTYDNSAYLEADDSFQGAMRYGNEAQQALLQSLVQFIKNRAVFNQVNQELESLKNRKRRVAENLTLEIIERLDILENAKKKLETIPQYEGTAEKLKLCEVEYNITRNNAFQEVQRYMENPNKYISASVSLSRGGALQVLDRLGTFRDSDKLAKDLREASQETSYQEALALLNTKDSPDFNYNQRKKDFNEAMRCFISLGDYRDSKDKVTECQNALKKNELDLYNLRQKGERLRKKEKWTKVLVKVALWIVAGIVLLRIARSVMAFLGL